MGKRVNNGHIYLNTNEHNDKTLNLKVGKDLWDYTYIIGRMRGKQHSYLLLDLLWKIFGIKEKMYATKIKEWRKREKISTEKWSNRHLPQHIKPLKEEFCKMDIEDRIRFLKASRGIVDKPTWLYNAGQYVFEDGQRDLSWTFHLDAALFSIKSYIEENQRIGAVAP